MPGYVIADIDVHDPEHYPEYTRLVPGALEAFGPGSRRASARVTSSGACTSAPSIAAITSPSRMPAAAAGLPSSTVTTTAPRTSPGSPSCAASAAELTGASTTPSHARL